jgi:D-amino-acid oxidase
VTTATPDVLVIGAGVCGLSAAIVLTDAGYRVEVYAADPPHRTTSAAAGALWGPHLVGADDRIGPWAEQTQRRFRDLATEPAAGISEMAGLVCSPGGSGHDGSVNAGSGQDGADQEPPAFTTGAGPAVRCDPADLPAGFSIGWRYAAPVVDMPRYLDYLLTELLDRGGHLTLGTPLRDLDDARERSDAPVIVNCAGIGARDLVPDAELTPVRGQVVVAANPGLTEFFVGEREDPSEVTYIFPHGPFVVLGGTQQRGAASLRPDPAIADRIIAHCVAAEPRLAHAPVLAHRVGLRPVRAGVRLETQAISGGRHLVHNYGHGGAGVTLSWGCAQDVGAEIAAIIGR